MEQESLTELHKRWHGTLKSYLIGLALCIILTLASFLLVLKHWLSGGVLYAALIALGVVQAIVQLLFFLHLGQETKPQWYSVVFAWMVFFLVIVFLGTLWIMFDLNERVM